MQNYFTADELKCKCCGKLLISTKFKKKLNRARELAGFPFVVHSGYRCEAHNKAIGSTSSNHTKGQAADIVCFSDRTRFLVVKAIILAGMLGIGIHKTFVHCDINRTSPALWLY